MKHQRLHKPGNCWHIPYLWLEFVRDILFHVGTWALARGNRPWLWPPNPCQSTARNVTSIISVLYRSLICIPIVEAVAGSSQYRPLTTSCQMRIPQVPMKPVRRRWPQIGMITVHHRCIMVALHRRRSFFRESGLAWDAGSFLPRFSASRLQLSYKNNTNQRLASWRWKMGPIRDSPQKISSCDRGLLMCPQPLMSKHGGSPPDPTTRRFSVAA